MDLFHYALYGNLEEVKKLVNQGVDVNVKNYEGENAIRYATENNHLEIIKFLVSKGADINAEDTYNRRPLHIATREGYLKIVKFLVKNGAVVNFKSVSNLTPLHLAAHHDHIKTVKFLISKGAEINAKNIFRETPLHLAVQKGHLEVVKLLVLNRAGINDRTEFGSRAIGYTQKNRFDIVEFLVENGANPRVKNNGKKYFYQKGPEYKRFLKIFNGKIESLYLILSHEKKMVRRKVIKFMY